MSRINVLFLLIVQQIVICLSVYKGDFVAEIEETNDGYSIITTYSNEFPYMIEILKDDGHYCGGSLIKLDIVITAAHCFPENKTDIDLTRYKLIAGNQIRADIYSPMSQWRSVKAVIQHRLYAYPKRDLALAQTELAFYETGHVKPINLPDDYGMNSFNGMNVVELGWGLTENIQLSDVLLKAQSYVRQSRYCVSQWHEVWLPHQHTLLCIKGYKNGGLCFGDSGGPIVVHNKHNPSDDILVGVHSSGISENHTICKLETPHIVGNIAMSLNWINKIINTNFKN